MQSVESLKCTAYCLLVLVQARERWESLSFLGGILMLISELIENANWMLGEVKPNGFVWLEPGQVLLTAMFKFLGK